MAKSSGVKVLCLALVVLLLVGCTSLGLLIEGKREQPIYAGVRGDFHLIKLWGPRPWMLFYVLIDLPFSLVLDTILLPLTISWELSGSDTPEVEVKPAKP